MALDAIIVLVGLGFRADAHRRLRRITWPDVIAGWVWQLLNEDLLLQHIPYFFWTYSWMCKNFCVKKFLRVKVSLWKTSLCNNFCVWKFLCVKVLRSKKHWYLQHFLRFCIVPAKHVKTPKFCNLQRFLNFEKLNTVRNMCQNGFFSDSSYPQKRGGNALGDAYEWPGFRPKSSPPAEWRIFGVFRGLGSEGRRLGVRLTIEL